MKPFLSRFRPADIIILIFSLLLITASALWAFTGREKTPQIVIQAPGSQWVYNLDEERELEIETDLGPLTVIIKDGEASVIEAGCPDKLCIQKGSIKTPGQWIACMPSRVMITVEGKSEDELDDIAY